MKLKETWSELHMSAVPVFGWTYAGRFLTMSPAAMVSTFVEFVRKHPDDCKCLSCMNERNAKFSALLSGRANACALEGDEDNVPGFHKHVISFEEMITLANSRTRLGMSGNESHDIMKEIFETYEIEDAPS